MRMNLDSIFDFVGNRKTAERGRAYFEESRVISVKKFPGVIEASVVGSQARPYEVRVELDRLGIRPMPSAAALILRAGRTAPTSPPFFTPSTRERRKRKIPFSRRGREKRPSPR